MVFQKKGGAKVKQQTPAKQKNKKNEDESMDAFFEGDSDSDDSESEQEMVKKTPGKTPKGKQNQNDKRVSFQIPGKNTPNKNSLSKQGTPTPNKNQVVKKQATPAKTNLKEFKGLLANDSAKKNGKQSKKQEESDDDDDDDEDDDEDMEDDADLDMLLGGEDEDEEDDDDDDEDDEEEDDDDDDDDDEEEEEEEQISPKKNQSKQSQTPSSKKEQSFAQNKTPVKNAGNTVIKEEKTPKDKTPKKSEKTPAKTVDKSPVKQEAKSNETPKTLKQAHELGEERIRERDSKTLYIGSLPGDITPTEIKTLSNDILNVTIPRVKDKKKRKYTYAFLEFASEAKAEENYKILKSKKLRGQPITIDYTGHKRQNQKGESVLDPQSMNMKKLYVSNLPLDATIDKVASMFPKAFQVQMNISPLFRSASINFHTEELAAEAMTASKDFKLNGLPVTVLYSNSKDQQKKRKRKNKSKNKNQPQKKVKLEIKQESDDDDDDDDDDEDEE